MTAITLTRRLKLIALDRLSVSALNVRKHGPREIASLAQSIRAQGLLQPLIGRAQADSYEIIAGSRRLKALQQIAREDDANPDVSVLLLSGDDDATAIEASLAENIERLPMDELDQYAAFAALVRQGRSENDIAEAFGVTAQIVRRRLALARLIPDVHRLYRDGEIDAETLKLLTLAPKDRQKAYVALVRDPDATPPPRWQLKAWLLGGAEIDTRHALFDAGSYKGDIAGDLFADARFFLDHEQFWQLQNAAVASLADDLKSKGWPVDIIGPDQQFYPHQWQAAAKAEGGRAVIAVTANGHVEISKGLIHHDEARKLAKVKAKAAAGSSDPTLTGEDGPRGSEDSGASDRPELTAPLANYLDLVRLAAVRCDLAAKPRLALRVLAAQLIAGSAHITVAPEPMTATGEATAASVAKLSSMKEFDEARDGWRASLGLAESEAIIARTWERDRVRHVLERLLAMTDAEVMRLVAFITAETLCLGSDLVDELGHRLATDCAKSWQPDDTFFDLIRDREVIGAMLEDVIGDAARSYTTDTGRAKKQIIRNALTGTNRQKVNGWLPKWLAFPQGGYTERPLTARTPPAA